MKKSFLVEGGGDAPEGQRGPRAAWIEPRGSPRVTVAESSRYIGGKSGQVIPVGYAV